MFGVSEAAVRGAVSVPEADGDAPVEIVPGQIDGAAEFEVETQDGEGVHLEVEGPVEPVGNVRVAGRLEVGADPDLQTVVDGFGFEPQAHGEAHVPTPAPADLGEKGVHANAVFRRADEGRVRRDQQIAPGLGRVEIPDVGREFLFAGGDFPFHFGPGFPEPACLGENPLPIGGAHAEPGASKGRRDFFPLLILPNHLLALPLAALVPKALPGASANVLGKVKTPVEGTGSKLPGDAGLDFPGEVNAAGQDEPTVPDGIRGTADGAGDPRIHGEAAGDADADRQVVEAGDETDFRGNPRELDHRCGIHRDIEIVEAEAHADDELAVVEGVAGAEMTLAKFRGRVFDAFDVVGLALNQKTGADIPELDAQPEVEKDALLHANAGGLAVEEQVGRGKGAGEAQGGGEVFFDPAQFPGGTGGVGGGVKRHAIDAFGEGRKGPGEAGDASRREHRGKHRIDAEIVGRKPLLGVGPGRHEGEGSDEEQSRVHGRQRRAGSKAPPGVQGAFRGAANGVCVLPPGHGAAV